MASDGFFYELVLAGLLWLSVLLLWAWPVARVLPGLSPPTPAPPSRPCPRVPTPFPGLTRKPCCVACEQAAQEPTTEHDGIPLPDAQTQQGFANFVAMVYPAREAAWQGQMRRLIATDTWRSLGRHDQL